MITQISTPHSSAPIAPQARDAEMWTMAKSLEASFLAEMLKSAGLGEARDSFGGGVGEDQFSSLLVDEQSRGIVETGGVGLAEAIYRSLAKSAAVK